MLGSHPEFKPVEYTFVGSTPDLADWLSQMDKLLNFTKQVLKTIGDNRVDTDLMKFEVTTTDDGNTLMALRLPWRVP